MMNLDCFQDPGPLTPASQPQGIHPGRRSLPPANSLGLQHVVPYDSYSSSTLHYYYPAPHHPPNYAHISSLSQNFQPHLPLPSASQSHIPSLRRTPSFPVTDNIHTAHAPTSPFPHQQNTINSRNSQHIHSLSPMTFHNPQPSPVYHEPLHTIHKPQPLPAFNPPPPIHIHTNTVPSPTLHLPCRPRFHTNPNPLQPQTTNITLPNSSLPSTKDVLLLTGNREFQGVRNPQGLKGRVQRVRVRVGISVPLANPYTLTRGKGLWRVG